MMAGACQAEDVVGHQLAKARKHHRQACEAAKVAAERGGEGKGMPAEPVSGVEC